MGKVAQSNENQENSSARDNNAVRKYATPAQDSVKSQLIFLRKQLSAAIEGRDSGLAQPGIQKDIIKLRKEIATKQSVLKAKESKAERQKKYRAERQNTLKKIAEARPDLVKNLHVRRMLFINIFIKFSFIFAVNIFASEYVFSISFKKNQADLDLNLTNHSFSKQSVR